MTSIFTIFLLLLLVFLLIYHHITRNFTYWKNKKVPFVKPVPVFGNAFKVCTLKQTIGEFSADLYLSFKSPILGFFVFDQPFLMIRDPELIKSVLIKDFEHFSDRSIVANRRADGITSDMLTTIKNPAWKTLRTKIRPVFASARMKNMFHLLNKCSKDLTDYVAKKCAEEQASDAREACMKYATDTIISCSFGIEARSFEHEDSEFRTAGRRLFDLSFSRGFAMAAYFIAPILVHLLRLKFLEPVASKFLKEVFVKAMDEREKSGTHRGDLLDVVIQNRRLNQGLLDEDVLAAQGVQFFIAGSETTASVVSHTLYEFSLNPAVQDHARSEIRRVIGKYGEVSYEAVQEMKYLEMAVYETLRKYPPVPFLDRRCTKPYKIPGTNVTIDKGIPVYVPLIGLHKDPEYFPDPERYDPERFSEEGKQSRPPYTALPFGEGQHNCIGSKFALLAAKLAMLRILDKFEVHPCAETVVPLQFDPRSFFLTPKGGLKLSFRPCDL